MNDFSITTDDTTLYFKEERNGYCLGLKQGAYDNILVMVIDLDIDQVRAAAFAMLEAIGDTIELDENLNGEDHDFN